MAWSNIILWYVLSCLMNQFYFTTLVYYFSKKYIEKSINELDRKPYLVTILIIYAIFCLSELGTFVYMVNSDHGSCKGNQDLIKKLLSLLLVESWSLWECYFLYWLTRTKPRKRKSLAITKFLKKVLSPQHRYNLRYAVNSPLFTIWIWVMANILGQIINEIENGLIYSTYGG